MADIMEPVVNLENQLEVLRQKTADQLLKQRAEIDEKLKKLGYGKRGRKPAK